MNNAISSCECFRQLYLAPQTFIMHLLMAAAALLRGAGAVMGTARLLFFGFVGFVFCWFGLQFPLSRTENILTEERWGPRTGPVFAENVNTASSVSQSPRTKDPQKSRALICTPSPADSQEPSLLPFAEFMQPGSHDRDVHENNYTLFHGCVSKSSHRS